MCWHQVDENRTILTCTDTKWMKTELFEHVLTPSGWKLNYSNPCWHQVNENRTSLTCADTKWMKTELFEHVLTPSGWKLNYSNLCWHQVDENWTIRTCADTKWMKLNYSNVCWHQVIVSPRMVPCLFHIYPKVTWYVSVSCLDSGSMPELVLFCLCLVSSRFGQTITICVYLGLVFKFLLHAHSPCWQNYSYKPIYKCQCYVLGDREE